MSRDIETIFSEVAGLTPIEREAYFSRHQLPIELRREVELLLKYDRAGASLTARIAASADAYIGKRGGDDTCGPYRLVRLLGGGGMGDVYLAERADGEVQQTAAIKFLRLGVDTPAAKERFLRERQILASLRHAGIANLLDAGHTQAGQPFLVMEYIDGTAIDVYCSDLSLRQKLELFLQVCEAVSYAHQNLVIHRDLKPSNILVDSTGRAKLLDFGIAKIMDETTDQTRTRERMLTPEYASPEQVRGMAQGTSTDVYSLGAVLYKILTGRAPHVFTPGAGESLEWVICNKQPVRASEVNPALPKDLDFILQMALRKEPESRYASAEALAEDIRSFLEWRPVRARSRNAWYRAQKFIRRYWVPVTTALIAIGGLAGGLIVASRERAVAERRFNDVRQLSTKLLDVDVIVRQLPGSSTARQFIVNISLDYLRRLSVDAAGDHDLALELATAYIRIGRVQGVPIATNLGQTDNAEKTLRIAEGLVQAVLVAQPNNRTAMLRAAQIAHDRMVLAQGRRPSTEATPLARTSLRWLEMYLKVSDWSQLSTQDAEGAVIVGTNVANWLGRGDDPSGAINLLHTVADFARKTNLPRQAASAQIAMARTLRATGDLEGALTAIRAGITLLEPQRGEKSVGVVSAWGLALVTEGEILGEDGGVNLGRPKEAEALFARGYEAALGQAKQDPADSYSRFALASRGLRLAGVLQHTDPKRALEILDEVLRFSGEIKDNSRARRDEARTLSLSSYPLRDLGRAPEARRRLDSAFDRLKNLKLFPADSVELGSEPLVALRALADYEAGTGNLTKSVEIYEQLLDKVMASKPTPESDLADANDMSNLYQAMAKLFRLNQRTERAAEFDRRSLELWTHWNRKLPGNPFVGRRLKEVQAASSH